MIIDARTLPQNHEVQADLCIVGAGAAGIALAQALAGSRHRVALLESGDLHIDADTQMLYEGENVGLPYFPAHSSRLRYFGGTTNHWGGYCDPFESFDFERRDDVPYTGWPIVKADLDSYYAAAAGFCQVVRPEWGTPYWEESDSSDAMHFDDRRLKTKVIQITSSISRNLGSIHRDSVAEADNVDVFLNANVTDLVGNEAVREVVRADVMTLSGIGFSVRAGQFVLAAGGIENARILLLSNRQNPAGLGNDYDSVGRFFADHPRFTAARFFPTSNRMDLDFYRSHRVGDARIKGTLILDRRVVEEEGLMDVQMSLSPAFDQKYVDALAAKSGASLLYMLKSLGQAEFPDEFSKHLSRVVFDIESLPGYVYSKLMEDNLPVGHVNVSTRIDPAPARDSRVALSESKSDALGQPQIEVDWRLSDIDKRSAVRAAEILGEELGSSGLGRLQLLVDDADSGWPADLAGGFHHVGTTRMSEDPRQGVVDGNCKVHGIANLHIAGSSVFATPGSGSPTMTIVALALRLADHLRQRMA